ncbi:MAG: hypothetical protein Q8K00_01425 [Syntrophales bacterium]|nr:hypothetical protein [Syntrophales bacterium]
MLQAICGTSGMASEYFLADASKLQSMVSWSTSGPCRRIPWSWIRDPNKSNTIQFVVLPDGVHLEFTTRINE